MEKVLDKLLLDINMNEASSFKHASLSEVIVSKNDERCKLNIVFNQVPMISELELFNNRLSSFFDIEISARYTYECEFSAEDIKDYYKFFVNKYVNNESIAHLLLERENEFDNEVLEFRLKVYNDFEYSDVKDYLENLEKLFMKYGINITIGCVNTNFEVSLENLDSIVEESVVENLQVYGSKDVRVTHIISNLEKESNNVCIIGKLFDVSMFITKNKKCVITLYITDYTGSIIGKLFIDENVELSNKILNLKNKSIKVYGHYVYDSYDREDILRVESIVINKEESVFDDVLDKRVELHVHTNMSLVDSVIDPKDLVDFCMKNGYKGVGVVDHNSVQSFPTLFNLTRGTDFKVAYGVELNIVEDKVNLIFNSSSIISYDSEFIIFDFETTGLNHKTDFIIEFGAVKVKEGEILDSFSMLCNPGIELDSKITEITGIKNSDLVNEKSEEEVLRLFIDWIGTSPLVAHNAKFDYGFLNSAYIRYDLGEVNNAIIDTLEISRVLHPEWGRHGLAALVKRYKVDLENHHRALDDAKATSKIFMYQLNEIIELGITNVSDINSIVDVENIFKFGQIYHLTAIVLNNVGLKNLFKLVSLANTKYFYKEPRLLKSEISKYREGLLIGSSCVNGEIFKKALELNEDELKDEMKFYDYIEVQPSEVYSFLIDTGTFRNNVEVIKHTKKLVDTALSLEKLVIASGDVHHLKKHDKLLREIIINNPVPGGGFHPLKSNRISNIPSQHFLSTVEMLNAFDFLDENIARDIVINNPNKLLDLISSVDVIKSDLYTPKMENSGEKTKELVYSRAKQIYGDILPEIVEARISKELDSIIGNNFDVVYLISHELVKKSLEDGYLVGSRGSVGSSLVATLMDITEVNPLPPHYICKNCQYSEFVDDEKYSSGYDLEKKVCPKCNEILIGEGHDIPFETFLGFKGDKVPDIDLNFSGEYQSKAHDYTKVLFGEEFVYRAGTISTIAQKTAFGYVKGYESDFNLHFNKAEIARLCNGTQGVKRGTGQHPGGILVVPNHMDIYDFTPIQYPADDTSSSWYTTHFDFHAIHDNILKLDILGHDDPTMLHMLDEISKISSKSVDITHSDVLSIFSSPKVLGIESRDINLSTGGKYTLFPTGTIGIPEFGTRFVMEMLLDTKPNSFAQLVKISGLSHGTDVWLNNGQLLIKNKICEFEDLIGCRDDIMVYLMHRNIDDSTSFKIMEDVRKGKGLTKEFEEIMEQHDVPDWYIDSCNKIKYMFPKAHATAYVLMALRIAYFKVFHPIYYYATYFSIRVDDFEVATMIKGKEAVYERIVELLNKPDLTAKEKSIISTLEISLEMLERGFSFENIDLDKSDATKFIVNENSLIPPFRSVEGLGNTVAINLIEERKNRAFTSIEDLKVRGKINKTILTKLELMNVLEYLPEGDQLTLF